MEGFGEQDSCREMGRDAVRVFGILSKDSCLVHQRAAWSSSIRFSRRDGGVCATIYTLGEAVEWVSGGGFWGFQQRRKETLLGFCWCCAWSGLLSVACLPAVVVVGHSSDLRIGVYVPPPTPHYALTTVASLFSAGCVCEQRVAVTTIPYLVCARTATPYHTPTVLSGMPCRPSPLAAAGLPRFEVSKLSPSPPLPFPCNVARLQTNANRHSEQPRSPTWAASVPASIPSTLSTVKVVNID